MGYGTVEIEVVGVLVGSCAGWKNGPEEEGEHHRDAKLPARHQSQVFGLLCVMVTVS